MSVLNRSFLSFMIFKQDLESYLAEFTARYDDVMPRITSFELPQQPHGSITPEKRIMWTPKSQPELTAFMPHVMSGDYFIAARADWARSAQVRTSTFEDEYPINELNFHEYGQQRRFVRAFIDDGGWDFFQKGDPLPGEDVSKYTRRLIKDRLRRDDVFSVLEAWGANVRTAEFWQPHGDAYTFVA